MNRRRRVPVLLQMSGTECAAACLAMVLTAHGRATSVRECREDLGVGRDGASGLQLVTLARSHGLAVTALSLDLDGLSQLALPAIVHWNFQHYLVLERWNGRRAWVVDPAGGRRILDRAEFSRGFTGIALQCVPGPDFERRRDHRVRDAWHFARGVLAISRGLLRKVLLASLMLQLLLLLPPLATKFVIDTVIGFDQGDLLAAFGVGVALLVGTHGLASYARGVLLNHLQARLDAGTMRRFVRHLFALPYGYFQTRTSGDLVMRLSSNALIREIVTGQTLSILIDGSFVLVYIVLVMLLAPPYGLMVLALGALQFAVVGLSFRAVRELNHRDVAAQAEAQSYTVEALNGAETVKATGTDEQVYDRWSTLFDSQLGAALRRRRLDAVNDALMGALRLGAPLALLWIGAWQVLAGGMTIGSMLALNSLAAALLAPLSALANSARQLQTVGTHLDRIRDVLDERVEQQWTASSPGHRLRGRVELAGVGFRYSRGAPWAVRDITLTIPEGAKVALVGRTGSGKTSLAKLILGLYQPVEGRVSFDGLALTELDLRRLRRQCGVVTQEPALFSGTVRDNIALGNPDLPFDEVFEAARQAQIHDEIIAMPMGYDTRLGEGGGSLSGGQRQRLALARALAGRPALLVLDEATSHLDSVTEQRVDDVLSGLACTRIVIAHRLSTVRNADLIVVLDGGRIVETGTHAELLARGGHYESLIERQVERAPSIS